MSDNYKIPEQSEGLQWLKEHYFDAEALTVKVSQRTYSSRDLKEVLPTRFHVKTMKIHTLNGLICYLEMKENEGGQRQFIHVISPEIVSLKSFIDVDFRDRENLVDICAPDFKHRFGEWYGTEEFIINLQSSFEKTPALERLLSVVGNVLTENIRTEKDDGITQEVETRSGPTLVNREDLPNPLKLVPFRTFPEVKQPESLFVLRAKQMGSDIGFALFEADNEAWQREAIANIASFFETNVPEGFKIPIIA